ncbi:hypothetical protein EJ08DRAFT_696427 [Tothia fuscella]|uniref:Uncharacterized protein n=1 Tax=Tothia fuscella TaxID=1048955 RepID=A0A9P4NTC9_9PEZI|nr:hypothetical protein EJ08DRAFT_696427 [Tothia fuscella]
MAMKTLENHKQSVQYACQQDRQEDASYQIYSTIEDQTGNQCDASESSCQTDAHYISTPDSNYRWWIPAKGIHEAIIREHVQPYLGPGAEVASGVDMHGTPGYYISAYRTFTPAMIHDMQFESAEYLDLFSKTWLATDQTEIEDMALETCSNGRDHSEEREQQNDDRSGQQQIEEGHSSDDDSEEKIL